MKARGYQRSRSGGSGRLRIVGGRFGGRSLRFRGGRELRPTPARTRETLFNWLQGRVEGSRVLDLFAGSGALGLEALSRGAAAVTFVERDARAVAALRENLRALEVEAAADVQRADALRWLAAAAGSRGPWDLVLLDPPFAEPARLIEVLETLRTHGLMASSSLAFCEHGTHAATPWPADWRVVRETRAGGAAATLLAPE